MEDVCHQHALYVEGMVLFFRRNFAFEDAIEFHTFVPLEALPCVCPITFLSDRHSLTGSHCKLHPNTEGRLGNGKALGAPGDPS
jgi:hypothetical protein